MITGWTSGATYNSLNGGISFNDLEAASSYDFLYGVTTANQGIDTYTGALRVNIPLSTAQQWVSYPNLNSGYCLAGGPAETSGDGLQVASSKTGALGQRPELVISYIL
jgi:hypothetical protein